MANNTTVEYAAEYLRLILSPLVVDIDSLFINVKIDDRGCLLTIYSSKEDVGKVIGRNGDTLRAIKRIIRQFGMSNGGEKIAIKIKDPRNESEQSNN